MGGNTIREPSLYALIGKEIGELVQDKQEAYGDSFGRSGEILKILYPNGVRPEQYRDLLTVTRIIDKLFRVANRKDAFGESPWRDIAGYAILAVERDEREARQNTLQRVITPPTDCQPPVNGRGWDAPVFVG